MLPAKTATIEAIKNLNVIVFALILYLYLLEYVISIPADSVCHSFVRRCEQVYKAHFIQSTKRLMVLLLQLRSQSLSGVLCFMSSLRYHNQVFTAKGTIMEVYSSTLSVKVCYV